MIIWLGLRWWYSAGWYWVIKRSIIERSLHVLEVFSVKEMTSTLFAPFRQTFTNAADGSIGDKLRAFLDKTISRFIGLIIRIVIISAGIICLIFVLVFALIVIIFWPLVPLMPFISIILVITG